MENKRIENNILEHLFKVIDMDNLDITKPLFKIYDFDPQLYIHSLQVAFYAFLIGVNYLGTSQQHEELFISALLHDYGKIHISKDIQNKKGKLTETERKIMSLHPSIGYLNLKRDTNLNDDILNGILEHHERIDGSGYMKGIKQDEISMYAKIIAIADVYDAMTSDRCYRRRINKDKVNDYLLSNAGKLFDKQMTEDFSKIINTYNIGIMMAKYKSYYNMLDLELNYI